MIGVTIFIVVTNNLTPQDSASGGDENLTVDEDSGTTNSENVLDNNYDTEGTDYGKYMFANIGVVANYKNDGFRAKLFYELKRNFWLI
jgi:hypothetical protein